MSMKRFFFVLIIFSSHLLLSQNSDYLQKNFCMSLGKIVELGRKDNFDSYDGTLVKQSPFLPVPGYSIRLDNFPVTYADKDHRFVAKTNLNMDSLTALHKLEELKSFVGLCLDSIQWNKWVETIGDDSTTFFFRELKEAKAVAKDLCIDLAVVIAAHKVYTINMYIKRRR